MDFVEISFLGRDFSGLPIEERLFFAKLAQVSDDLRHIQNITVQSIATAQRNEGVEREIATHQWIFGVRMWCATLNEGWKVVTAGWNGGRLGARYYNKLTAGKEPYDYLRRYFGETNLVRQIRDTFASHYLQDDHLKEIVDGLNPEDRFHFVTSKRSGNIFFSIAENFRILALIATADGRESNETLSWSENRASQALLSLYEEFSTVSGKFISFCADVLPLIITAIPLRTVQKTTTAVSDPANCDSIIFIDEEAIMRWRHTQEGTES